MGPFDRVQVVVCRAKTEGKELLANPFRGLFPRYCRKKMAVARKRMTRHFRKKQRRHCEEHSSHHVPKSFFEKIQFRP